jgi:predicted metal-dependent peptidase
MADVFTPREKLQTARLVARSSMPYFASALWALVSKEAPWLTVPSPQPDGSVARVPTLAVTKGGILLWHPAAVERMSVEELAGALLHEVSHVLRDHCGRTEMMGIPPEASCELGTKAFLANLAQDACINEDLREAQQLAVAYHQKARGSGETTATPFTTSPDWIYPEKLQQPLKLMWEERYMLLLEQQQQQQKKSGGSGAGGGGGKGKGDPQIGTGWCGGSSGHPVPDEPADGGIADGARSDADLSRVRRQVAEDIRNLSSKSRGLVPGGWQTWADLELAPPRIDWRTRLARYIRAAIAHRSGAARWTWSRLSRRQGGLGFGPGRPVVPALRRFAPRVALGLDTSGSMGEEETRDGLSEAYGVLKAAGAPVDFCVCDAKVHGVKKVASIEDAIAMLHGGGGTDMTPIFEAFEELLPRPNILIICTDGYIGNGHPKVAPDWAAVIWLVVGGNTEWVPPWGDVVYVDDEKKEKAA